MLLLSICLGLEIEIREAVEVFLGFDNGGIGGILGCSGMVNLCVFHCLFQFSMNKF